MGQTNMDAEQLRKAASDAARHLRAIPSEKRTQASKANGKQGGRPLTPLSEIECSCGGAGLNHKTTCKRGRVIRYRQANNLPLK